MEGRLDMNPGDNRTQGGDTGARIAAARAGAEVVLALIDQSRLRRECLKLALAQHNARWRVLDMPSGHDVLRLAEAGQHFDLLLLGAATSEHIDLEEIEALRAVLPDTPIVVAARPMGPAPTIATVSPGSTRPLRTPHSNAVGRMSARKSTCSSDSSSGTL